MKRLHFSDRREIFFEDKAQVLDTKPRGLWYGFDNSWIDWVHSNMPEWEETHFTHKFKIEVDESKILVLKAKDMVPFTMEFSQKRYGLKVINWPAIAKEGWCGIEIPQYHDELRLDFDFFWYYGWDCASGCIWNKDVLKDIVYLSSLAKEREEGDV